MLKRAAIAALAAAALAAGGCAREHAYPPGYEARFISACEAGGAPAGACGCMWGEIRRAFSVRQFDALDAAMKAGQTHPLTPHYNHIAANCAAQNSAASGMGAPPGSVYSTPPPAAPPPILQPPPAVQQPPMAYGGPQPGNRSGSNAGGGYPESERVTFMRECQGPGASADMCACAWRRIVREVPYAQYRELDGLLRRGQGQNHPLMPRIQQISTSCGQNPYQ